MTLAPRFTASRIASDVSTGEMPCSVSVILIERILAAGATPVNETPATGAAAMMPATDVP